MAYTYSFLDVHATLVGPGININMGSGAALSDEGITINPSENINAMTIGASGEGMHSLHANISGEVIVRTLKDSPLNAALMAAYAVQTAAGANHGQNTITISNINAGDVVTCQQVAFRRAPNITYAKEGGVIEWQFDAVAINRALG